MARPPARKTPKPALVLTGISLTAAEVTVLRSISEDASDIVGRRISSSCIVRALVQWMDAQPPDFVRSEILPLVEKELALLRWGRKKLT